MKNTKNSGGGVKMDRNEEWQRLIEEYRQITVPQDVRDRIQEAVERGKRRAARRRRAAYISTAASGAAAVVLILLPNLNAHMADKMGRVPVVGSFFRAVTVRQYSGADMESALDENGAPMALDAGDEDGFCIEEEAAYDMAEACSLTAAPESGTDLLPDQEDGADLPDHADGTAALSDDKETEIVMRDRFADAGEYTRQIVERFEEENAREGGRLELIGYEVVTDSDEWFTLIIYANESGDAEYTERRRYYNVDKRQDVVMSLGELYNGRDYVTIISDEIISQMEAGRTQKAEEETAAQETEDATAERVFTRIDENQNYYFNEDGNLVIVLDGRQINAAADGHSEYVIAAELLE